MDLFDGIELTDDEIKHIARLKELGFKPGHGFITMFSEQQKMKERYGGRAPCDVCDAIYEKLKQGGKV